MKKEDFISINGLYDNIDSILSDLFLDGKIDEVSSIEESKKCEALAKDAVNEVVETYIDEDGEIDECEVNFRDLADEIRYAIEEKLCN